MNTISNSLLQKLINEAVDETTKECPASTQDVSLNTANRDRAIQDRDWEIVFIFIFYI